VRPEKKDGDLDLGPKIALRGGNIDNLQEPPGTVKKKAYWLSQKPSGID
jgi:hypothetical protein